MGGLAGTFAFADEPVRPSRPYGSPRAMSVTGFLCLRFTFYCVCNLYVQFLIVLYSPPCHSLLASYFIAICTFSLLVLPSSLLLPRFEAPLLSTSLYCIARLLTLTLVVLGSRCGCFI